MSSLRVRIVSVCLFILVASATQIKGVGVPSTNLTCYALIMAVSFGIWMLLSSGLNKWLKLFLLGSLFNPAFTSVPSSAICLAGIIVCLYAYHTVTRFSPEEANSLIKFIPMIVLIQAIWVVLEWVRNGYYLRHFAKDVSLVGTIGYVNLVSLLMAIAIPVIWTYRRNFLPIVVLAWIVTCSSTSILAGGVACFITFYKKSFRYYTLLLVFILMFLSIVAARKNVGQNRIRTWKATIQEIKKSPVFGQGFGAFRILKLPPEEEDGRYGRRDLPINKGKLPNIFVYDEKTNIYYENIRVYHAHNSLLELTREGGIICSISILGYLLTLTLAYIRRPKTVEMRVAFGMLCGFMTGSLFTFPDKNIGTASIMLIVMACVHVLTLGGRNVRVCKY